MKTLKAVLSNWKLRAEAKKRKANFIKQHEEFKTYVYSQAVKKI